MITNENKMSSIPKEERPYEKCLAYGPGALSDAELLAVILRSGTNKISALELARQVLDLSNEKLLGLYNLSFEELRSLSGIGHVKAIQLKAIGELARRMSQAKRLQEHIRFASAEEVALYFMESLRHKQQEEFHAIFLNTRCQMIREEQITIGTANASLVSPREIFSKAIRCQAVSIILVHNHPSGDCEPSPEDIEITLRMIASGNMLGIEILDHIIIGDQCFASLKEQGIFTNEQ